MKEYNSMWIFLIETIIYIIIMKYIEQESINSNFRLKKKHNLCSGCMDRGICKISDKNNKIFKCKNYFEDIYMEEK